MVILRLDGSLVDYEYDLLVKILALLDVELRRVNDDIEASQDPESDGLYDLGEFLIGSGFVAIQRYLNTTRAGLGLSKRQAYGMKPKLNEHITTVRAINAISNYWKHCADWEDQERQGLDPSLSGASADTIRELESIGDLGDYPSANALAIMLPGQGLELSNLLSTVSEWRDSLLNER